MYGTVEEQERVNEAYLNSRSVSIDYGVMERADNVYVSCADFGWSDIGTWGSLYQQLEKDSDDNALSGDDIHCSDTKGCLVKELSAGKHVVVDGLKNFLVVDTDDVLMICPIEDEGRIRQLIESATSKRPISTSCV